MKLLVKDYQHQGEALIGKLYIDGEFACYTLEDWEEDVNHRVKRGTYKVFLRHEGRVNDEYSILFKDFHKGMLHILVPGRLWILVHCGNSPVDTLGCLLVGSSNSTNGKIDNSRAAYKRIYPKIAAELLVGKEVFIEYAEINIK